MFGSLTEQATFDAAFLGDFFIAVTSRKEMADQASNAVDRDNFILQVTTRADERQ